MATTVATTAAQIVSQFRAASSGDIIEVAPGFYTEVVLTSGSGLSKNTGSSFTTAFNIWKNDQDAYRIAQRASPGSTIANVPFAPDLETLFANNVTIRAQDVNDPPIWRGAGFDTNGVTGLTMDGLHFIGNQFEDGTIYPDGNRILSFDNHKNFWIKNITVSFHRNQLWLRLGSDFVMEYCHFERCGIDNVQWYAPVDRYWIHHNQFDNPMINYARHGESDRHPDVFQVRSSSSYGWRNSNGGLCERNYFVFDPRSGKPWFMNNPRNNGDTPSYTGPPGDVEEFGYKFITVRDNYMNVGRQHCITTEGTLDCVIEGNLIRSQPNPQDVPSINLWGDNIDTLYKDNVMPRTYYIASDAVRGEGRGDGINKGNKVFINNVISASAVPPDWVPLVPGENVGPYAEDTTPTPETPARPVDEFVEGTSINKDGRIGTYTPLPGISPTRWTGVLIIPSTAPAGEVDDAPNRLRWKTSAMSEYRPFKLANPSVNASGAYRYEMTGLPNDPVTTYSVLENTTFDDIVWSWSKNGVWSLDSSYEGSFTSPDEVDPPTELVALQSDEWEFVGDVYAVPGLNNRFTKKIRIIPATGPTYTGLQWDKSDDIWRTLLNTGTDGEGAILWELQPLETSGIEHTVGHEETLTIRLRYSTGAEFSPASATTKSFTGPEPPLDEYERGDQLVLDSSPITIAGIAATRSLLDRPTRPEILKENLNVHHVSGIVTVQIPSAPPAGTIGQFVTYAGDIYFIDEDGNVAFNYVSGKDYGLIRSYNDLGHCSAPVRFPIPAEEV